MAFLRFFKNKKNLEKSSIHKECPKDKHNFVPADSPTGGMLYKCEKCGLEVFVSMFSGEIFKEYFGSYFGGISHKWNSSDMRAEDIVGFDISFGDCPIVTVRYNGVAMKVKNSIDGSRDGWMSFPKGYFDEKTIKLSHKDKNKLYECLRLLDFDSFTTLPDLFLDFGAAGFCIRNRFLCRFSNGRGFECLSPCCDSFNALIEVVKSVIGNESDPVRSEVLYDSQETGWICSECGAGNSFSCTFCGKCGAKRPW